MPKLLSKFIQKKVSKPSGLSRRNEHLKDEITDFTPRDYIYVTSDKGGSKFIRKNPYDIPSHILALSAAKSYDETLSATRITQSEAQFYAEKLAIIPSTVHPLPEDELRAYLLHWAVFEYRDRFGAYPDVATIKNAPTEEILAIYRQINSKYTPTYLARLMFEERERHIVLDGWFNKKSGYLILTLGDNAKYHAYTYGKDGEEYAVTVNCEPVSFGLDRSDTPHLLSPVFGVYGLIPMDRVKDYSLA